MRRHIVYWPKKVSITKGNLNRMVRHPFLCWLGMSFVGLVALTMPERYSERFEYTFYRTRFWKYATSGEWR